MFRNQTEMVVAQYSECTKCCFKTVNFMLHEFCLNLKKNLKEKHKPTIMVRVINNPLSATDGTTRQKISKDIQELNSTINQQNLTSIYRNFRHLNIFLEHFTQSSRKHILFKCPQNKFKGNKIILGMFSDHNEIKLKVTFLKKNFWTFGDYIHSFK